MNQLLLTTGHLRDLQLINEHMTKLPSALQDTQLVKLKGPAREEIKCNWLNRCFFCADTVCCISVYMYIYKTQLYNLVHWCLNMCLQQWWHWKYIFNHLIFPLPLSVALAYLSLIHAWQLYVHEYCWITHYKFWMSAVKYQFSIALL